MNFLEKVKIKVSDKMEEVKERYVIPKGISFSEEFGLMGGNIHYLELGNFKIEEQRKDEFQFVLQGISMNILYGILDKMEGYRRGDEELFKSYVNYELLKMNRIESDDFREQLQGVFLDSARLFKSCKFPEII